MYRRGHHGLRFCVLPGYNWCGPGCSGPGEPINEIDAVCKVHDECYKYYGDKCHCDEELMRNLSPYLEEQSLEGRHARLLNNYMKMQSHFTCRFGWYK